MRVIKRLIPRRYRHFFWGIAARAGFAAGRVLPRRFGLAFFSLLGAVCYYLLPGDRGRAVGNLRFIYGQRWCDRRIRKAARAVFRNVGKNLFDAVKLNTLSAGKFDGLVSHDSLDGMAAARARGRGFILVTAHLGCFEMLLHFFVRNGFGGIVVGRHFGNPAVDGVVRRMRSGPGIEYIDRSEDSRRIVRSLREGKAMGVLIDQDTTRVEGVFADFLGHPAYTPSAAIRFAMKFEIPIFVAVTARVGGDRHHVFISPELPRADTGDFEADLAASVQTLNGIIGSYILKYPEQWVWMHDRWRTRQSKAGD